VAGLVTIPIIIRNSQPIPSNLKKQIIFPVFYPSRSDVTVKRSSMKYDSSAQVLSFIGYTTSGDAKLVFSEEPTPDPFNDVSGYYTAVLNNLNQYEDFNNVNGQTYLTRPKNLGGNESAVMSSKGTLMFIRTFTNLSTNQWTTIFNDLTIVVK
jgi:hypothetical protein